MCLFAVDGTWSQDFNAEDLGNDQAGRPIGNQPSGTRSNTRRFFDECRYPPNKKFFFSGPGARDASTGLSQTFHGMSGMDSGSVYRDVLETIMQQVQSGNCTEIVMVGWSRGAAVITELTQGISNRSKPKYNVRTGMTMRKAFAFPPIKFVGLFDSVAMNWSASPNGLGWGEEVTSKVEYFAHVIAGDRTFKPYIDFWAADPTINAERVALQHFAHATHSDVGGKADTDLARAAYAFIRNHAAIAGVP